MPRIERRGRPVSGMGGHLNIYHNELTPTGSLLQKQVGILDVARWQVRHRQVTVEVTHSGSNGAIKRAVVARDFTFACQCPWNSELGVKTPQLVLLGFLEQILVGHSTLDYNIGIEFFLGDLLHYPEAVDAGWPGVFLKADLAIAEDFTTICDCTGKEVVRLDFAGSGNSLLEGWRGAEQKFPLADTLRPLYNP